MVITKSTYGDLIVAKIVNKKNGSGLASDKLTILTLSTLNDDKQEKLLCWNSDYEKYPLLSDKARTYNVGDYIVCRVKYDIGDTSICTCLEMKKTGLFKLVNDDDILNVIVGNVVKTFQGNGVYSLWIPSYKPNNEGSFKTEWYKINFFGQQAMKATEILKNDYVIIRCGKINKVTWNDREFKQATGTKFTIV